MAAVDDPMIAKVDGFAWFLKRLATSDDPMIAKVDHFAWFLKRSATFDAIVASSKVAKRFKIKQDDQLGRS